jgi:hypothetical protein
MKFAALVLPLAALTPKAFGLTFVRLPLPAILLGSHILTLLEIHRKLC